MLDANAIARELAIVLQDLAEDDGWELTTGEVVVNVDDVEPGEQQFTVHLERTPFSLEGCTFIVRVEALEPVTVHGYND